MRHDSSDSAIEVDRKAKRGFEIIDKWGIFLGQFFKRKYCVRKVRLAGTGARVGCDDGYTITIIRGLDLVPAGSQPSVRLFKRFGARNGSGKGMAGQTKAIFSWGE
jgi:hypothetical protein